MSIARDRGSRWAAGVGRGLRAGAPFDGVGAPAVLATSLIHRIWNEFRTVIAVLPANSRVREPAKDRIRKTAVVDPKKADILGPQPNTNRPSTIRC